MNINMTTDEWIDELRVLNRALGQMLEEPEPGLMTWHIALKSIVRQMWEIVR